MKTTFRVLISFICSLTLFSSIVVGEIVNEIKIIGNERIPDETILMFSDLKIGDDLNNQDLNKILNNLYETNFFDNVSIKFIDNIFLIKINEAPIIQNVKITGVKANKFNELIKKNLILKEKSFFNKIILAEELEIIKSQFRQIGFYFSEVEAFVEELGDNLVNIEYKIDIGDKSKISKISFIGDKIYKNRKLKNIIVSEEYKFWKFISGKKYLQEQLIDLDKRLLKNFYLNRGY